MITKRHLRILALVIYFAGYVVARDWHLIVHTVSWSVGHQGKEVVEHGVEPGDVGIPLLNPMYTTLVLFAEPLYGPVRSFEERLWKIAQPSGTLLNEEPEEPSAPPESQGQNTPDTP